MLSDVLKLGDKIDIKHLDKYGRPARNARTYASQLMDFVDFDVIHIATPISSSTPVILNVGENYNLCFYSAKGLYQCNCVALKNIRENNVIIAVVRVTTNLEKFQRRQYYRLEFVQSIEFRRITREEEMIRNHIKENDFQTVEESKECKKRLIQLENNWILATLKDISGGGSRFITEEVLNQGDKVQIRLDLTFGGGINNLNLSAVIITSNKVLNKAGLYEYRVEFIDIAKKDREDLIKYIFEEERKRR